MSALSEVGLPTSGLFHLNSAPNARVLVETDPRFTHQRNFLGSEYFLKQLAGDSNQQTGNIRIQGSQIAADGALNIAAGNNVDIVAAEQTASSQSSYSKTKSGVFGSGVGFTIGKQSQNQAGNQQSVEQVSSTLGSLNGDVSITAGGQFKQSGSDIIAKGDIDISAKKVAIEVAHNLNQSHQEQAFKQSGLSVGLSGPLITSVQNVQEMSTAAGKVSDPRIQALALASAAVSAKAAAKDLAAIAKDPTKALSLNISIGSSKSSSHGQTQSSTVVGSKLTAGGNVNIEAAGDKDNSTIQITGSDIQAKTASLKAEGHIDLQAANNSFEQHSKNESKSASLGLSIGTQALGVTVSGSTAKGNANGQDQSFTHTHITAEQVSLESGSDTVLKGAVVKADQVKANIGGDLKVESLQDTSTYNAQQKSAGGSLSLGTAGVSGSANVSKAKVNGEFASVQEQSGIKAGDGGFELEVKGNTDLKGGVIASSQKAIEEHKNSLTTATLTTSDLNNKDEFEAKGYSLGVSSDKSKPGANQGASTPENKLGAAPGMGKAEGSQESVTTSAISQGTVTITDEAKQQELTGKDASTTVASINRDVISEKDASNALNKAWDGAKLMDDVQAQVLITRTAMPQIAKEIGSYSKTKFEELTAQGNVEEANKWKEGGAYHVAAHAALGALGGGVSGALGPEYQRRQRRRLLNKSIRLMHLKPLKTHSSLPPALQRVQQWVV